MSKFTIKHVDEYGDMETLHPADEVAFFKKHKKDPKSNPDIFTFWVLGGDRNGDSITSGTVYVMNDNGKTVSVYHLNHSENP